MATWLHTGHPCSSSFLDQHGKIVISERPPTNFTIFVRSDPFEYLAHSEAPDPGPERPDTVYVPGNPGAAWTQAEIEATRYRILQVGWAQ